MVRRMLYLFFQGSLFLYVWVFAHNVCTCTTYMQCPTRPEDSVGSPGTVGRDGYEQMIMGVLGTKPRSSGKSSKCSQSLSHLSSSCSSLCLLSHTTQHARRKQMRNYSSPGSRNAISTGRVNCLAVWVLLLPYAFE